MSNGNLAHAFNSFQAVNFIELQPTVLDDFAESNSVKLNRPRKIF